MPKASLHVIPSGWELEPCPNCGTAVYIGSTLNQPPRPMYIVDPDRWPETRHPRKLRHGWGVKHHISDCRAVLNMLP